MAAFPSFPSPPSRGSFADFPPPPPTLACQRNRGEREGKLNTPADGDRPCWVLRWGAVQSEGEEFLCRPGTSGPGTGVLTS